jgi:hypothetical protein
MQPVAALTLEVTALHAVIALEVADDRLYRLTAPEQDRGPLELPVQGVTVIQASQGWRSS